LGRCADGWDCELPDEDLPPQGGKGENNMTSQNVMMELHNVTMDFGGLRAVDHLSFSVERGKVTALIGPNGAGKTTAINLISGVYKPTGGQILFEGKDIIPLPAHERATRGIARTFQIIKLFPALTVLENIMLGRDFGPKRGGDPKAKMADREEMEYSRQLLRMFNLEDKAYHMPYELSFGQQRWIELARAMAMEPKLLLLDEPSSGLSVAEAESLLEKMRSLCTGGCTILLVEHNMRVMAAISAYVIVLNHGQKLLAGTPDEVKNDQKVIEVYLGKE